MKKLKPDGIITQEPQKYKQLIDAGIPTIIAVHLKEHYPDVPYQFVENEAIGTMAAEHLLERGFKNFAYCGVFEMASSLERCESFAKKIIEHGYQCHIFEEPKSKSKRSWEIEQPMLQNWLKSLPKPVGIMTSYDERSRDVAQACKSLGLYIPEQVAIIGVDNDQLICEMSNPPLSSIDLSFERTGYEMAEYLDKLIADEKMTDLKIMLRPTGIITRQSTDILAVDDPDLAMAVRFIRDNQKNDITVIDVLKATTLSRRVLEKRFRKILARSINEEIVRVRIAHFAKMLVDTNLNVTQISETLNFPSLKHVSRCFSKEKGMTPLQYRKEFGQK